MNEPFKDCKKCLLKSLLSPFYLSIVFGKSSPMLDHWFKEVKFWMKHIVNMRCFIFLIWFIEQTSNNCFWIISKGQTISIKRREPPHEAGGYYETCVEFVEKWALCCAAKIS